MNFLASYLYSFFSKINMYELSIHACRNTYFKYFFLETMKDLEINGASLWNKKWVMVNASSHLQHVLFHEVLMSPCMKH